MKWPVMKRMVFWKILIGFWVTTVLITQGVWIMFNVLQPQEGQTERTLNVAVIAATAVIEKQGEPAFRRQLRSWPPYIRNRLAAVPASPGSAAITDPSGRRYTLVTRLQGYGHGPFDTPWQVILVSIIGGLGFSGILAWYMTAPIQTIRSGFDRLAKGDFSTRLVPSIGRRRDEIADLARDFDVMARHLEALVKARERLLADVSHELRSPLARLQLAIGLARQDPARIDASLERIGNEAIRLDEMVGELLTLSKLESGVRQPDDYFDFAEVVRAVVADAVFEAAPMGVQVVLDTQPDDGEWISLGSGKLVSHAVENIVRNALRFSRRDQRVTVRLDRPAPDVFRLSVTDQGPGVPPALLATLFDPFVQGAGEGKGFGLGLAIAQRAVIGHGGGITARNEENGGLRITVSMPAAADSGGNIA